MTVSLTHERGRLSGPRPRPLLLLSVTLMVCIAGYLVTVGVVAGKIVPAMYGMADADLAPYLTLMWHQAPHGSRMLMANFPWYGPFWLMSLTRWLPDYRGIWEVEPWVVSGVASLFVAWATGLVAGKMARLLALAGLLCAGTLLLELQFSWIHTYAYANVCILGAFAVWLINRGPDLGWPRLGLAVSLVGAFTATGLASDKLTLVAGLVPFAIASLIGVRRLAGSRARVLVALGGFLVEALAGAAFIGHIMRAAGLVATPFAPTIAPVASMPSHLLLWLESLLTLFNGAYGATGLVQPDAWHYLCTGAFAVLAVFSLVEAGSLLWRLGHSARVPPPRFGETSGEPVVADRREHWNTAREVSSTYWVVSAVVLSAIYVFSTIPIDVQSKRYVVSVAYAAIVLSATRAGVARRLEVTVSAVAAVSVVAAVSIAMLITGQVQAQFATFPSQWMAQSLEGVARREHASAVYAGYWDAMPLGWFMDGRPPVYPVNDCGSGLCRFVTDSSGFGIDSWYRPRAHARSLLVLDAGIDPPPVLGRPSMVDTIPGRQVYLYRYDIASRLGP